MQALSDGLEVHVPVYDFASHERLVDREPVRPARLVVVEGILVLYEPELRERFDLRVFVDTGVEVRVIRRLERDVAERERSPESVIEQYLATVRPSHQQFIEPSKRHADVIVPHGGMNAPRPSTSSSPACESCSSPGRRRGPQTGALRGRTGTSLRRCRGKWASRTIARQAWRTARWQPH